MTALPAGYTPHGRGRSKVHVRGPDSRESDSGRWGACLCGNAGPPAYRRRDVESVEDITCDGCRKLLRHAIAQAAR